MSASVRQTWSEGLHGPRKVRAVASKCGESSLHHEIIFVNRPHCEQIFSCLVTEVLYLPDNPARADLPKPLKNPAAIGPPCLLTPLGTKLPCNRKSLGHSVPHSIFHISIFLSLTYWHCSPHAEDQPLPSMEPGTGGSSAASLLVGRTEARSRTALKLRTPLRVESFWFAFT